MASGRGGLAAGRAGLDPADADAAGTDEVRGVVALPVAAFDGTVEFVDGGAASGAGGAGGDCGAAVTAGAIAMVVGAPGPPGPPAVGGVERAAAAAAVAVTVAIAVDGVDAPVDDPDVAPSGSGVMAAGGAALAAERCCHGFVTRSTAPPTSIAPNTAAPISGRIMLRSGGRVRASPASGPVPVCG